MAQEFTVQCYAHGRDGDWEAICVDFDIAVQGESFDQVRQILNEAIATYVEDVFAESPETRRRLLKRRSPWHVRLTLALRVSFYNLFHGRRGAAQASFPVLCHG